MTGEAEQVLVPKALLKDVLETAYATLDGIHSEFCIGFDSGSDGRHQCDKDKEKIDELWRLAGLDAGLYDDHSTT